MLEIKPLLSIIITTFNREKYLRQLINSILSQKYSNFEIIVIDDNSTDGSDKLFDNEYSIDNIKYIKRKHNYGPSENRRLGFEMSKGRYIIFADDDDYYNDNLFFTKAIDKHIQDHTLSFVSGNANILKESNKEMEHKPLNIKGKILNKDYLNNFHFKYSKPYSTFTTVFSKEKLNESLFQELFMINDASIYLNALLSGHAYILEDVIGIYRMHDSNITKGLNIDFIIENIEQKSLILEKAEKLNIIQNATYSRYNNILLTLKYYIKHNKIDLTNYFKITKYIIQKAPRNLILLKELNKLYFLKLVSNLIVNQLNIGK